MAATLENISQLERRLNISLPSQEIDSEVQTRLKQLARNVKMHGFRPGKVPLKVVAQQYEDQVRREVLGEDYVARAMANADEFSQPLQELVTEFAWGIITMQINAANGTSRADIS